MRTKAFIALIAVLAMVACANTMHVASVSEAFKQYETQDYAATLKLIAQAESTGQMSEEQEVQLIYLKALAYDGLGENHVANRLYAYISEQHPSSQYAYLLKNRSKDAGTAKEM